MTFEQIETFVQVARARSFSRAGIVLNLAQPTLSGRIAALEAELGASLFHRRGHTVEPTEAGRALMPYAERMLALRAEGLREAQRAVDGGVGRLLLGANPTCSQYLAPRLIERFWREHPALRIWVRTALSPALMESLLDGAIQLVLCARAQLDLRAQVLWSFEQPLLVVASAQHPLARRPSCRRADLAEHTILSTQAGPTHLGLRHLLPPGAEREIALEATAGEVMKQLLLAGIGLTVLPALAVHDELERGDLVALNVLDADLPAYEVALARWSGRDLPPAASAFAAMVGTSDVNAVLSRRSGPPARHSFPEAFN
jgi:DNA-binding transcriptional LysR family regulator